MAEDSAVDIEVEESVSQSYIKYHDQEDDLAYLQLQYHASAVPCELTHIIQHSEKAAVQDILQKLRDYANNELPKDDWKYRGQER